MSTKRKNLVRRHNDAVAAVDLKALQAALPIFWPARHHIPKLPHGIGPGDVMVLWAPQKLKVNLPAKAFDSAIIELSIVYGDLHAIFNAEASHVFARLWWLAAFLSGTALDLTSDLLVSAKATSPDWDTVLGAAASVTGYVTERSLARGRFYGVIDELRGDE